MCTVHPVNFVQCLSIDWSIQSQTHFLHLFIQSAFNSVS